MITQTELFPKTKTEIAEVFLEHFQADVESAEKSLGNARAKLRAAVELRDMAEANLMRARNEQAFEVDADADEEQVDAEDAEVLQIEDGIDPITGQVARRPDDAAPGECVGGFEEEPLQDEEDDAA